MNDFLFMNDEMSSQLSYREGPVPLYCTFMYSLVPPLSGIYVTDKLGRNGTTRVPKSVHRYVEDKDSLLSGIQQCPCLL